MEKKYPAKLFWIGVVTNFLFRFIYLSLLGLVLCIVGIWIRDCLWVGLAILLLDLVLSIYDQMQIRKAALTPSDNPEFNELMAALTGPGGLEAFGKVPEEKIGSAPSVEDHQKQDPQDPSQ